jgi:preprotein translocase subunit SecE
MKRLITFFKDSYAELRKVIWPSREEVASNTKVVLVSVAIFAVVLGVIDFIFVSFVDFIF